MPLDTQVPAWLQRNWAPRETFDPTPWLQERYKRQVDAQIIPLKIQGMQLQNQAEQLQIEHQAMQNEQAGIEMQDYKDQLPMATEWFKQTRGNPQAMLDTPLPAGVTHPKLQQQILNAQHNAAQSTWGQTYQQQQIADTRLAVVLQGKGIDTTSAFVEGPFGPEGPNKWDHTELSRLAGQYLSEEEQRQLRLIDKRTAWHFDAAGNPISGRPGGLGSALAVNIGLLEQYEGEYNDALASGDPEAADSAMKKMDLVHEAISRSHRDVKLESEVRLNERLINTLTVKLASEIIPSKKAEIQSRLDEARKRYKELISAQGSTKPFTPAPVAPPAGGSNYIWTPQGTKPK